MQIREGASAPPGCDSTQVVNWITAFLDAAQRGDAASMADRFVEVPIASVDDRPKGEFRQLFSRDKLVAYYMERYRAGESQSLRRINVGYSGGRAQFGFEIDRQASDLDGVVPGKGEIDCESGQISIWNVGQLGQIRR